jgi:hypothetical protein
MSETLYKPFGMLAGVLGGLAAGMVFKQLWSLVSDDDETPDPIRADETWTRVLLAAAAEGAVYALVKAAVNRGTAVAFEKATGEWPGDEGSE